MVIKSWKKGTYFLKYQRVKVSTVSMGNRNYQWVTVRGSKCPHCEYCNREVK